MATWHQRRNPTDYTKLKGWNVVSDKLNECASVMNYGDREDLAREHLANVRERQPNYSHLLYHDGKLKG